MNGLFAEVDYESDFEFDESDFESDYEDYPEFDPESRRRRRPQYRTPRQPQRGPGTTYTRAPTSRAPVTQEQLRQALVRVKQDIDRVATGVRSNTANLNDFAGRTGRNFNRLRDTQRRDVARLDRGVAGARELSVLGAVLAGAGDGANVLLPLLILGMEQPQPAAPGAPADGMLGGSSNTTLLLALAVSGALNP